MMKGLENHELRRQEELAKSGVLKQILEVVLFVVMRKHSVIMRMRGGDQ